MQNDSACAIAWLNDGRQGIEVYIDPALTDRQAEICQSLEAIAAEHTDLDGLSEAVMRYAEGGGLSAGIHEPPPDATAPNILAIVLTVG